MGHRRRSRHHKGHAFAAWPRALVQKGQAGVVPHQMNCHHRPPQHDTPAGGNPPWCSASCMWPCCGLTGGSGSMAWCGVVEGICKPRRPSRRRREGSGAMRWGKLRMNGLYRRYKLQVGSGGHAVDEMPIEASVVLQSCATNASLRAATRRLVTNNGSHLRRSWCDPRL